MIRTYAAQTWFLALTVAWLLASTQIQRPEGWSLAGVYGYWTVRIVIEAGLFLAFAELIGRLPGLRSKTLATALLAAIVSLVPFALSITAMDLILGLPELGGSVSLDNAPSGASAERPLADSRVGSFLREIVYLSDNHLALCLILTAPRLFEAFDQTGTHRDQDPAQTELPPNKGVHLPAEEEPSNTSERPIETGYMRHLDHPLNGDLLRVEAQEHYVRLVSDLESRMVLYRFNDIVSELPGRLGMQVHRSHWVAFAAAESLYRDGGRLWLGLTDGSKIPVSRKYSEDVQSRFGSTEPDVSGTADGQLA